VVRGADLADNTPRQQWLQDCLQLPRPRYLHTPLRLDPRGEKLSKQHGAPALDTRQPLSCLQDAANFLGLELGNAGLAPSAMPLSDWLARAVSAWSDHLTRKCSR